MNVVVEVLRCPMFGHQEIITASFPDHLAVDCEEAVHADRMRCGHTPIPNVLLPCMVDRRGQNALLR